MRSKLDSVQPKLLCNALGINRLAHKVDVNQECGVWPLELRRWYSLINYYKRAKSNSTEEWNSTFPVELRLKNNNRASFFERLTVLSNKLRIDISIMSQMKSSQILLIFSKVWENVSEIGTNPSKRYHLYKHFTKRYKLSYSPTFEVREKNAI